ncbi:MAG: hypothetical protein Q8941_16375 [Bacteroidota bacterium]|nr:hypothetical protein [Bacteroidota bacterium]
MRPIYTTLALCIVFSSCTKNDLIKNPASEYFPNTVGNYWKYKYVDSISNKSVFVYVNITGNTVLPNGQNAKIWVYTFPDHTVTNFVCQVGDTTRFIDSPGLSVRYTYITPLRLNNTWRTSPDYIYDSTHVDDNSVYFLNNQDFVNSFLLQEYGHLPNQYWGRSEWFCPNIGIVTKSEKSLFTLADETSSVYWELVEYNLK